MVRFKRLFLSFKFAIRGLIKTFKEEQNLRIQGLAALTVIVLAVWLHLNRWEWLALILAIGIVLILEVLNSAVERVCDLLKPRLHSYVKEIKDIMSAAVFLAALLAVVVGIIVFAPYF
ncbi:diacylglycerol kinase family protein [Candidatus Parcubacteria bacterium]|nr:MAG: diacylglycerol kinase family protein [Candidatus Parcubacteria bacterium]